MLVSLTKNMCALAGMSVSIRGSNIMICSALIMSSTFFRPRPREKLLSMIIVVAVYELSACLLMLSWVALESVGICLINFRVKRLYSSGILIPLSEMKMSGSTNSITRVSAPSDEILRAYSKLNYIKTFDFVISIISHDSATFSGS